MLRELGMLAALAVSSAASMMSADVRAASTASTPASANQVDLVIALDVSGSMSGLIDSARQRLWDIVNQLGAATPRPELRVAILSYGSPSYGRQAGYVRIDQPFTRDLDAVNATLFAFRTDGGDEYVARAVERSVSGLQWSEAPGALRMIFVAGNEPATQDPLLPLEAVAARALQRDIIVNTIYCGGGNDPDALDWQRLASLSGGMYASIDQQAAATAGVASPMDDELLELNEALNRTYLSYGRSGERYRANQLAQDDNAAKMSAATAASRVVTKGGGLYHNAHWDLVDAIESGRDLAEFEETELPAELQAMSEAERRAFLVEQSRKRERIEADIADLARQRARYLEDQRSAAPADAAGGLDEAIQSALRGLAGRKGFSFEDE